MLILVSLLKSFAVGKTLVPNVNSKTPGCLEPDEEGFPQSIKINISIIHTNQTKNVMPDASKRSTSPWDYSITEDPNRFPSRIAEATCRHTGCMDATGKENYSVSSVPIRQEILVIRRKYRGCEQTYQLEKQWVTVGCTCARPQLITSA
ncbi:PREDICTED: interleukin-17F-like [Gekko japonicus]|uniref:Interleukin-17F-like n=1 Tax=Gekko japonicus TaxID=146911 RepID=A0ABM1L1I9_GEKJA|nr:PREDICTED: interleukin-17F-like [Gekko japonicus]